MTKHSTLARAALSLGLFLAGPAGPAGAAEAAFANSAGRGPTPTESCTYVTPLSPAMSDVAARFRDAAIQPGPKLDIAALRAIPRFDELMRVLAERDEARKAKDWANLCRYAADNAARRAKGRPRAVFLGDSITENWQYGDPSLFSEAVLDRGISGQTTSQILLRFYSDVAALHPAVVHIMAGTNDVAGNAGPIGDEDILNNLRAMIDIAQANGVRVVLASIPPIARIPWQPTVTGSAARVDRLNAELRRLASRRGVVFVDYHAALKDAEGGLPPEFANDGVHPNRSGYARIRPLTLRALEQASRDKLGVVQ